MGNIYQKGAIMFRDLGFRIEKEKRYVVDEYFVVEAEEIQELNRIVNEKLKEGFSFNGKPYTDGISHYQPMVKYRILDEERSDDKRLLFEKSNNRNFC